MKILNGFPILNIDKITTEEEIFKLREETEEFINGIQREDKENMKEEFFDVIQVLINIMYRYDLIEDTEKELEKHINKLKNRNWEITKYI